MRAFLVMHRTILVLAIYAGFGVGGITLAHHTGKSHVKVTQLSQREISEKLDGKADAVHYGTQLRGASNAKAKRELGFQPRPLEWNLQLVNA